MSESFVLQEGRAEEKEKMVHQATDHWFVFFQHIAWDI